MKAIIFDFGGVVALHKGLYYIPIFPDVEVWHQAENGEIPEQEFWKKLEEYYHKTSGEILQMLFDEREPNKPLIEFLKGKKAELKFAFINNGLEKLVDKIVSEWKLGEVFDVILVSAKEKLSKPDPKIFLLACERLGVKPEDCLFAGKKQSYVDVAISLGMRGFVYQDFVDFQDRFSQLLT